MIAVTGGTGFLGSHVLEGLKHQPNPFVCLVRKTSPHFQPNHPSARRVDFDSVESIQEALKGCTHLLHLMGLINGEESELYKVNVKYTDNLLRAAKNQALTKLVFMSSVAAIRCHGYYGQTKFEAENLIRQSGIPYLIFRGAFIYGRGDELNTGLMIKTLKRFPVIPLLGGGNFKLQPVYVEDVASVLLQGMNAPARQGIYSLAGAKQISLYEILTTLTKALKIKRLFMPVPLKPVQSAVRIYASIFKKTRLPVKQILELDKHEAFDISETVRDFNFHPISFQEGISKMFGENSCAE